MRMLGLASKEDTATRKRNLFLRFLTDSKGVTAIEFAVVALPFFMLLFALVEFGLAFFVNRMLDYAALETTRLIRTGQITEGSVSMDEFKSLVCENFPGFPCDESLLSVDVRTVDDFASIASLQSIVNDDGTVSDELSFDPGAASEIVVARLIYRWPMFTSILQTDSGDTGDFERLLYSTVIFRNEPYAG